MDKFASVASYLLVLIPESPQEFTCHLLSAFVAALVECGHDRAVTGIATERVIDAAQHGLQLLAVLAVLAGLVVWIISHAVHVFVPFVLSFARDTHLPHPRFSRSDGIQSRKFCECACLSFAT